MQQRALPGAGLADNRQAFACVNLEVKTGEYSQVIGARSIRLT
jgi:hypothetical protein